MLTLLIALALLLGVVFAWRIVRLLTAILDGVEAQASEVRELRLTSRARIGTIGTAPVVGDRDREVHDLKRLGRASRGKRIVYGGDPESGQYQDLKEGSKDV